MCPFIILLIHSLCFKVFQASAVLEIYLGKKICDKTFLFSCVYELVLLNLINKNSYIITINKKRTLTFKVKSTFYFFLNQLLWDFIFSFY